MMVIEAARKMVEFLDRKILDHDVGAPFFSGKGYVAYPFEEGNFNPIVELSSERRLAFIDGGNGEVLRAPNFSIQVNRVFHNLFEGRRRVVMDRIPQRLEFFSATISNFREGDVFYDTFIFPVRNDFREFLPEEDDLSFSSLDRSIRIGDMRADISRAASLARRFAEWDLARYIIEADLREGDVVVIDGTLQTTYTNEAKYARRALEAAEKKGVIFTGLAKTSNLYTKTGASLLGTIQNLSERWKISFPTWYYHPVAEVLTPIHKASIFVVKLNSKAEYVFRFEIYRDQMEQLSRQDLDEIFGELSKNSSDISFPGYPYGLIDADANARVNEDEAERYRMLFLSEISRLGRRRKFAVHIRASDAHDVLDSLMG